MPRVSNGGTLGRHLNNPPFLPKENGPGVGTFSAASPVTPSRRLFLPTPRPTFSLSSADAPGPNYRIKGPNAVGGNPLFLNKYPFVHSDDENACRPRTLRAKSNRCGALPRPPTNNASGGEVHAAPTQGNRFNSSNILNDTPRRSSSNPANVDGFWGEDKVVPSNSIGACTRHRDENALVAVVLSTPQEVNTAKYRSWGGGIHSNISFVLTISLVLFGGFVAVTEAVFTPTEKIDLKTAVTACLAEDGTGGTGNCLTFAGTVCAGRLQNV